MEKQARHPHRLPDTYILVRQLTTGNWLYQNDGGGEWMSSLNYATPFADKKDAWRFMLSNRIYSAVEMIEVQNVTEP